jgi:hypothetical protein
MLQLLNEKKLCSYINIWCPELIPESERISKLQPKNSGYYELKQPVPRLRMVELYLHSPICLHGMVLN